MLQEIRQAFRSLGRAPSLTAISILTVGLGAGAGTALFSVVKAVLLNPLPYPDPSRLAWVTALGDSGREIRASLPDFDDWQNQNHAFASMAAYGNGPFVAGGGESPQRSMGSLVTEDFFDVIGVKPLLGRTLSKEDHRTGGPLSVVLIGHGLWQRAYGGKPSIVGSKITVLGVPSTVIGVMPAGFAFPEGSELWASARTLGEGGARTAHNFWVVGRIRDGMSMETARNEISSIAKRIKQQYPGPYQSADAIVLPLSAHLVGNARLPLLALFGAVGLLLLIVCVNVTNLLLVRINSRSRELAVRTALGAGRARLFRHLFMESLVLATAGGTLGLLIAFWSMDLLRMLLPASVPRGADVRIDAGVILFAVVLSIASGVLFGTVPAWRASALNIHDVLKAGARGQTHGRRSQRLQGWLVISEVALSVVLITGAGLLIGSFARLRAVDAGFVSKGVLAADLSFPADPPTRAKLAAQYRDLLERVRALPGVEAVGTIKDLPLEPLQRNGHFFIEQRRSVKNFDAGYLIVSPGLMETLRIPLLRGRTFADGDSEATEGVAIVSAEMARRYWPDRDPIGERIWFDSFESKEHWLRIVGVAGDVRQSGLTSPAPAQAYVVYPQVQIKGQLASTNLMIRSAVDPRSLIPSIRRIVRAVNPEVAARFRTMDDVLADATSRQRFQMQVLATFAALALILSVVGLYGVLSYTVTSNRAQIGIRMALGAQPAGVFRMVTLRGLTLAGIGAAAGVVGCLAVRSLLKSLVFGVGPSDPLTIASAVALMLVVAVVACCFPARRAMRVDPMLALREE